MHGVAIEVGVGDVGDRYVTIICKYSNLVISESGRDDVRPTCTIYEVNCCNCVLKYLVRIKRNNTKNKGKVDGPKNETTTNRRREQN